MRLDYRRLLHSPFIEWLGFESEIVPALCAESIVVSNWPDVTYSVDIFKASQLVDYTAWDNYSPMPGDFNYEAQYQAGIESRPEPRERIRRPLSLVAEASAGNAGRFSKGAIRLQSFLDMAHGSSGTIRSRMAAAVCRQRTGDTLSARGGWPSRRGIRRVKSVRD